MVDYPHGGAVVIWRDYNTDGEPASGPYKPQKYQIREFLASLQSVAAAGGAQVPYLDIPTTTFEENVTIIMTSGVLVAGDGGHAFYYRAETSGSIPGAIQSADGSWWRPLFNIYYFKTQAYMEAARIPPGFNKIALGGEFIEPDTGGAWYNRADSDFGGTGIRTLDRYIRDGSEDATNGGYWYPDTTTQLGGGGTGGLPYDINDITPPGPPTAGIVVADNLGRLFALLEPPTDADFRHYKLYTTTGLGVYPDDAIFRVEGWLNPIPIDGVSPNIEYTVYATAVDYAGNESTTALELGTVQSTGILAGNVVYVYATTQAGDGQSFTREDRAYYRIYTYNETAPVLPISTPPLFIPWRDETSNITPVFADDDIGTNQSFAVTGKSYVALVDTSNRLQHPLGFDESVWVKTNVTISANVVSPVNPRSGSANVDKIVEAAGGAGSVAQSVEQTLVLSKPGGHVASFYVKPDGTTQIKVIASHDGGTTSDVFDLSAITAAGDGRILEYNDDWLRVILPFSVTTLAGTETIKLALMDGAGNETFTGDGTSGVFVSLAVVEPGVNAKEFSSGIPVFLAQWFPFAGVNTFASLTDVDMTSEAPVSGDVPVFDGTLWLPVSRQSGVVYDIACDFPNTPEADEVILRLPIVRSISLNADFAGSEGVVAVNPTGSFVITVKADATTIGTITISTGGAFTFATTSGTAKTLAIGEVLTFVAPGSADATIEGIAVTILGVTS